MGVVLAAACFGTATAEDIMLRGMGSFHVGGRIAEVSGKDVRMIQRQPGGPMTKLDPNGQYMVEQMYVQFFLPKAKKGKGGKKGCSHDELTPDGSARAGLHPPDGYLSVHRRSRSCRWPVSDALSVACGLAAFGQKQGTAERQQQCGSQPVCLAIIRVGNRAYHVRPV